MKTLLEKSKEFLTKPQETILSAATIIMIMIIASRLVGLLRLRVLAHYFVDRELALFFASFRLPDLVFEVLTLGALSSAFIPVFTAKYKTNRQESWRVASSVLNIGILVFVPLAIIFSFLSLPLYTLIAPGFSEDQTRLIANLARILFAAQGFFVISYALTGVLESLKRFIIPALAPIFYNLGIILGTILFSDSLGLMAPAIGVVIGACAHFFIQLPFAYRLGFRFSPRIYMSDDLKKIGRLAFPRIVELFILQISKIVELFLASIISVASYTYYTFAYSAQALPLGLIGLSIAKAALPTLASQSDEPKAFKKTLVSTLNLVLFLIIPMSALLIVMRIPMVRLLFGTDIFDWTATVQTGLVLSSFALGIPFQAAALLLTRAFYALHDTKTPVKVSLFGTVFSILLSILLVRGLGYPTWALATSFAAGQAINAVILFVLVGKKLNHGKMLSLIPIIKSLIAAGVSGGVMYFVMRIFDRSVWIKQLSFLSSEAIKNINFENFVLDTRYTVNLIILTVFTSVLGAVVYILISLLLRSEELYSLISLAQRHKKGNLLREQESIAPLPTE